MLAVSIAGTREVYSSEQEEAELSAWDGGSKPFFSLDDLSMARVSLAGQRADVVIVHFFATWCEPCREELPALNRLVARSDPNRLRVLTISVAEVDVRVRTFVEKMPLAFPVLLDRDRSVTKSWKVSALPTSFILDCSLTPRLFVERDYAWDRFDPKQFTAAFKPCDGTNSQARESLTTNPNTDTTQPGRI